MYFPTFLRISAVPLKGLFEIRDTHDNKTIITGAEGEFLNLLSVALHFKFNITIPSDKAWGTKREDGSWSGMIGQLQRSETDIALTQISTTYERSLVVDFSRSYSDEEYVFATNKPRRLPGNYDYLQPFDLATWLLVIAILFVTPALFSSLSKFKLTYEKCFFDLSGTLIRMPVTNIKYYRKFILGFWLLYINFLSFCYLGVIQMLLIIPKTETPIRTFEELSNAVESGRFRAMLPNGVFLQDYMLHSERKRIQTLGKIIKENKWYYDVNKICSDSRTVIINSKVSSELEFGVPPFSTKYISEDTLAEGLLSIAIHKDFCCKSALDRVIVKITETGIYQKFLSDAIFKNMLTFQFRSFSTESPSTFQMDSFYKVRNAFIFLCAGCFISVIFLITEVLISIK